MCRQIDQYVWNCCDYQPSQILRYSTFGVPRLLPVPETPLEDISIDLVVELPECKEFDAIWVVVDRISKM